MQCAYNILQLSQIPFFAYFCCIGRDARSDIKHCKVQPNVVLFNAAISAAEKVRRRMLGNKVAVLAELWHEVFNMGVENVLGPCKVQTWSESFAKGVKRSRGTGSFWPSNYGFSSSHEAGRMKVCIADTLAVMNFHSRTRLIGIPWNSWFLSTLTYPVTCGGWILARCNRPPGRHWEIRGWLVNVAMCLVDSILIYMIYNIYIYNIKWYVFSASRSLVSPQRCIYFVRPKMLTVSWPSRWVANLFTFMNGRGNFKRHCL